MIADRVDLIPGTKGSGKSALYRILVDFLPDILIRDLEKSTVKQLKARAVENGRSLQAELKDILDRSAQEMTHKELYKRTVEFSKRFEGRKFTDSVELLREDRQR